MSIGSLTHANDVALDQRRKITTNKLWYTVAKPDSPPQSTAAQSSATATVPLSLKLASRSKTGKKLWSFQTGSGISGLPITWQRDGRQYVTVTSGAATVYGVFAADEALKRVPAGSSVWTFALME